MKDKTLEMLGEKKVKVENNHIEKLRTFWKNILKKNIAQSR